MMFWKSWILILVTIEVTKAVDEKTVASTNQTENRKGPTEQICKTANGADGKCISINSCKYLKYIFEYGPQPFSREVVDQLKSYICGFEGTGSKVCCPSDDTNSGLLNQGCGKRELFDYPWIALLSYQTNSGLTLKCQGIILTDRYILTTAHCANATQPLIGVRVGEPNVNTAIHRQTTKTNESVCMSQQDLLIEKVILHHNYSKVFVESSIALLRVDRMDISVDGTTVSTNQTENQEGPTEQICKNATGDQLECININSCNSLKYIFESEPPFSKKVVDQLKSYICGFEGTVFKVCCPSYYFYLDEPDSAPIDVSNHKNIGLLNQDCGKNELFAFSWIALLLEYQADKDLRIKCHGTVLNDRYILTTTSCANYIEESNLKYNRIFIRVGERDLNTVIDCRTTKENKRVCATRQDLRIEKVILHHNYSEEFVENNIGLIRVQKINITDNVKPVCLPTGNLTADNLMKEPFTAVGFGKTETGRHSPVLLQVKLPLVPLDKCREIYKEWIPISKNKICAGGDNGKDVCDGDSGGPLQYLNSIGSSPRYVQYGLVIYGPTDCGATMACCVYERPKIYELDFGPHGT